MVAVGPVGCRRTRPGRPSCAVVRCFADACRVVDSGLEWPAGARGSPAVPAVILLRSSFCVVLSRNFGSTRTRTAQDGRRSARLGPAPVPRTRARAVLLSPRGHVPHAPAAQSEPAFGCWADWPRNVRMGYVHQLFTAADPGVGSCLRRTLRRGLVAPCACRSSSYAVHVPFVVAPHPVVEPLSGTELIERCWRNRRPKRLPGAHTRNTLRLRIRALDRPEFGTCPEARVPTEGRRRPDGCSCLIQCLSDSTRQGRHRRCVSRSEMRLTRAAVSDSLGLFCGVLRVFLVGVIASHSTRLPSSGGGIFSP
jgi:hypothetical protein